VSTPGDWATRADRDAAVRLVESAWADGQIVEADRDRRIVELARAESTHDVELLVHDLRAPTYQRVPEARPGPRSLEERTVTSRRGGLIALLVAMVAVMTAPVVAFVVHRAHDAAADDPPPVLTGRGYADLVAAVRAETGGTQAFSAVLYPDYAALDLPVDASSQRMRSWYWDGELVENTRSTTSVERFDLAEVDMAVVLRLLTRVQSRVEDETSWYVIVHAPGSDGSTYQVYASNEYQETAYVTATPDGTITYRSDPSS
jgi:hypothetical protein